MIILTVVFRIAIKTRTKNMAKECCKKNASEPDAIRSSELALLAPMKNCQCNENCLFWLQNVKPQLILRIQKQSVK